MDLVPVAGCFDLPQQRVNARTRLNQCLRPCRVDHAKSGSPKNGQIRCVGMNFDTPTSPLRFSVDVIATIMFGSLGHWDYTSFPSEATPQPMVRSGREGINFGAMSAVGLADSNSDTAQDCSWGEADIPEPPGGRSCMEPIVSAGLVYVAHRTCPSFRGPPTPAAVPFLRSEDIMSTTTLLIILLVVLLLGGGGIFARRRW